MDNFENIFDPQNKNGKKRNNSAAQQAAARSAQNFNNQPTPASNRKKKKKTLKTVNIILYVTGALLILLGGFLLLRESSLWLDIKAWFSGEEIKDYLTESEIEDVPLDERTTYTPLATPVDNYDIIPVKFIFSERDNMVFDIYATGFNDDGTMGTVDSASDLTWLSVYPYAVPGDTGNAVISGHNQWKGEAGSFSLLKKVHKGEKVAILFDKGFVRYFEVTDIKSCKYNDTWPMEVEGVDEPILTLITCEGDWSDHLGTSKHRVIVICKPIKDEH